MNLNLPFIQRADQPLYDVPDKSVSKATRQKWLLDLCKQLVEKYIFGESEVQSLVEETQTLQDAVNQPFRCRATDCQVTYVHHSRRVRYNALNNTFFENG